MFFFLNALLFMALGNASDKPLHCEFILSNELQENGRQALLSAYQSLISDPNRIPLSNLEGMLKKGEHEFEEYFNSTLNSDSASYFLNKAIQRIKIAAIEHQLFRDPSFVEALRLSLESEIKRRTEERNRFNGVLAERNKIITPLIVVGQKGSDHRVALSYDQKYLYWIAANSQLKRLNFETEKVDVLGPNISGFPIKFAVNKSQFVYLWQEPGDRFSKLIIGDLSTGRPSREILGNFNLAQRVLYKFDRSQIQFSNREITAFELSREGNLIYAGDRGGKISIWNSINGSLLGEFSQSAGQRIESLSISPNNEYLISTNTDGRKQVWNIATRKPLFEYNIGTWDGSDPIFSEDGSHVIVSENRSVRLLRVKDRAEVWRNSDIYISTIGQVIHEGRFVAKSFELNTGGIYDALTGKRILDIDSLDGSRDPVFPGMTVVSLTAKKVICIFQSQVNVFDIRDVL